MTLTTTAMISLKTENRKSVAHARSRLAESNDRCASYLTAVTITLLLTTPSVNAGLILSGAALFSTDSNKNYLDDGWNTISGDFPYNLWMSVNGDPLNGPTDGSAGINVAMAPGIYNFAIYGNPGSNRPFHGLSLFFDGDVQTPQITVFSPTATDTSSTAFTTGPGGNSPNLGYTATRSPAGTNSFTAAGLTVALTAFRWEYTVVQGQDLVGGYSRAPNGQPDNQGVFTLTVTQAAAVPEPASFLTIACGVACLGFRSLRGKRPWVARRSGM